MTGVIDQLAEHIQVNINRAADVNPINLLALAILSTPKHAMAESDLLAPDTASPAYRFVASDDPLQFLQLGQRFLGDAIEGVEIRTLG